MLVSLDEYLDTADSPDREYVDGAIVERHVGERPHSLAQKNSVIYLRTPAGGPTAKEGFRFREGRLEQVEAEFVVEGPEIGLPLEEVFRGV